MPEILLHYIWQRRIWSGFEQKTTDGREIEIISVGSHNNDAGPDFTNVHLRIDGQDWIGNVEMHIYSSDWYKHHHHLDKAYNHVILHVVCHADKKVYDCDGHAIAQCELSYPHDQDYLGQLLVAAREMDSVWGTISCSRQLLADPGMLTDGWRKTMLHRRMECKHESIRQLLQITQQSWSHAFYISLAHNFGFHTNGVPFETLAIHTPLSYLQKHRNSLFQLTAMLLGQSGLLRQDTIRTEEDSRLWSEYQFLQQKFSLQAIDGSMWKYAKLRPQNFPEVRIRQFAQIFHQSEFLFARLMDCNDINAMVDILQPETYTADDSLHSISPVRPIGKNSIYVLLINTIIPYKYAYAFARHDDWGMHHAFSLLETIPAEDNTIVRQWRLLGQHTSTSADTQALIHLYQAYCQPHRCFHCGVGYQIFLNKQLPVL